MSLARPKAVGSFVVFVILFVGIVVVVVASPYHIHRRQS
jgi:hypothetical protein